ncbi:MAG TPA: rhodanese-like domain-containing protein [Thermoleophilaceae bacterium]|jgi:rhodanese-related sulfurtransferase|nr:rhodanese-like domain-containing protein [Thermoleophilaceae bacterium]
MGASVTQGCHDGRKVVNVESVSTPEDISPAQANELVREGRAQLVDVRTPEEHSAGRIAGALHIELDQLPSEAHAIEQDRPVVFYCRMGSRSALATGAFRAAGFEAYNLDGGLLAWVDKGLPIEPENGSVAPH